MLRQAFRHPAPDQSRHAVPGRPCQVRDLVNACPAPPCRIPCNRYDAYCPSSLPRRRTRAGARPASPLSLLQLHARPASTSAQLVHARPPRMTPPRLEKPGVLRASGLRGCLKPQKTPLLGAGIMASEALWPGTRSSTMDEPPPSRCAPSVAIRFPTRDRTTRASRRSHQPSRMTVAPPASTSPTRCLTTSITRMNVPRPC